MTAAKHDLIVIGGGPARYRNNARGGVIGDDGLLKLIYASHDMRLIGAHLIGEQAIELINIGLMAMQMNATFQAFIDACFNFPSLAELYKYATYDAMKRKQQGRINPADRLNAHRSCEIDLRDVRFR